MKPNVIAEFEETAVLGSKAVRAFLTYQGANRDYFNKARVGVGAMGSYARLRATMANEQALRLMELRSAGPNEPKPKAIAK